MPNGGFSSGLKECWKLSSVLIIILQPTTPTNFKSGKYLENETTIYLKLISTPKNICFLSSCDCERFTPFRNFSPNCPAYFAIQKIPSYNSIFMQLGFGWFFFPSGLRSGSKVWNALYFLELHSSSLCCKCIFVMSLLFHNLIVCLVLKWEHCLVMTMSYV